ncbi:biotin--[acetyl-CoA-carboxylase] ligase [Chloroflexota bacterium]
MELEPDSLSLAAISNNLATRFIGQRVIYYPSLTSTMEVARREAQQGAAEGTVVIADEQTAGQGRMQRVWLSPKGSLALSVILYPGVVYLPSLIMVASLAVVHSIEEVTGLKPRVKWPNDILIGDKKVCGVLIESRVRGNVVDYSIIGIGVNVNLAPSDLNEVLPAATSLSVELGREVSRLEILRSLLVEMERLYLSLLAGGPVYEEWRDRLMTLGRRVSITWGKTKHEGVAESVARDGSLLLRHEDGRMTKIVAGDVTLRE